jgi:hypothetical protein
MKKLFNHEGMTASTLKTTLTALVTIMFASSLWIVSLPAASMTPAEMIQSKLPPHTTIATATDAQLLQAVGEAVRQWPKDAALIVRTAAGARKSIRADILCIAIRSARERGALDCNWVLDILREWIKADPGLANQLTEAVSQCAPECREALQSLSLGEGAFTNPPNNINAPPGSVGGGGGGNVCLVCHNGTEIQVACSDLENYLKSHPGDTAGPCVPTPTTNP